MRALIISGGQVEPEQLRKEIHELRRERGILIAADSGLQALDQLLCAKAADFAAEQVPDESTMGADFYLPDVAVGDFDSVDPAVLQRFLPKEIRMERHRAEKNETDTELAFSIAQEAGATSVTLMGATGTRLDHTLSNIHLLKAARDRGLECTLLDRHNRIRLVAGRTVFRKTQCPYPFVSFIPLTMRVQGITLTGFKYPLQNHDLTLGQECGLCVSNELAEEEAVLEFTDGLLLVIEARD